MKMDKNLMRVTGFLMVFGGCIAMIGFIILGPVFGYPEIIRAEPSVLLKKLHEQRHLVPYLYYIGVGGAGLCLLFASILFRKILRQAGEDLWSELGQFCGMISGLLLYAGIIRYTFLFPFLAEQRASGKYPSETVDLVFMAFNKYVGDSIAEHVQFTFTSLMFVFFGIAILKTKVVNKWIGWFGIIVSAILIYGNTEMFGVSSAFIFNRIGADLIGVWTIAVGINLLIGSRSLSKPVAFAMNA
jgi:hypothetical protein